MSYVVPDYAAFIARFPIFGDTTLYPTSVVNALLAESAANIDTSWIEADYSVAILYLTAHKLALENSAAGDTVAIGGPGAIASESFAGMSVSYQRTTTPAGSAANSTFGGTVYGQRYYALLVKNKPGVVVA